MKRLSSIASVITAAVIMSISIAVISAEAQSADPFTQAQILINSPSTIDRISAIEIDRSIPIVIDSASIEQSIYSPTPIEATDVDPSALIAVTTEIILPAA